MRVLTWNLWWRYGPWTQRQATIHRTLARLNPDIIMLQEAWRDPAGENQAAMLADRLGYHHVFESPASKNGIEVGNAILTRWPIAAQRALILPTPPGVEEARGAVQAELDTPHGRLPVISTHLSWERNIGEDRLAQVQALVDFIDNAATSEWPPIIGGDFNADPDSEEIRAITGRSTQSNRRLVFYDAWEHGGDGTRGSTWTPDNQHYPASRYTDTGAMPWLRRRIDYIFVGLPEGRPRPNIPVQVERAWIEDKARDADGEGPDHYAVVADLLPHRLG